MKPTTIILALFLWGCGTNEERLPEPFLRRVTGTNEPKEIKLEKPFIIVYKFTDSGWCADGYCAYEYHTANGIANRFCDIKTKYQVGDTIK